MPTRIPFGELSAVPLSASLNLTAFDCGDGDLNHFLKKDAFTYAENAISRTYIVLYRGLPAGFFSLCMDAIRLSPAERLKEFGTKKPHRDYPALKIARLAVATAFQRRGVGRFMVDAAIGKAGVLGREVGCRFVTVDAYPAMTGFYTACGFALNLEDRSGAMASLRLDLLGTFPSSTLR